MICTEAADSFPAIVCRGPLSFVAASGFLFVVLFAVSTTGCTEPRSQLNAGHGVAVDTLRILSYNIHHGEGMDEQVDLQRIADLIRSMRPDVVALQEVDSMVDRTNRIDQASVLGKLTGLQPVFGAFMPYQGGAYGMAVLSRWHVMKSRNIRLPEGEEPRTSVTVWLRSPETGQDIVLSDIHFYRTEEERLSQAGSLERELEYEEEPVILAGDFNSEPGSAVIEMLARDFQIVEKGQDRLTFSSFDPVREIDFVMVRPEPRIEVLRHTVLDEPVASDHRPIYAEFLLRSIPRR